MSNMIQTKVGVAGFEPTTSCAQGKRSTKLSYTPIPAILPNSGSGGSGTGFGFAVYAVNVPYNAASFLP